jgi:hypothetical protein
MSDNVSIALIDAAAMVLLLIAAYAIDRRAGSRRITQSIDSLRDRVSGAESSLSAGLGAVVARLQRLEESVDRLHEGQVDIRERLARLEGETMARKPTLWPPREGTR